MGADADRGERTLGDTPSEPTPRPVSVEVIDETDAQGDTETEVAVVEEVTELVEELAEGAAAGGGDA